MPRKIDLDRHDKQRIASLYTNLDWTQNQIAEYYGVSRRTIHRVLQEMGVDVSWHTCTAAERRIIDVAQRHKINAEQLNTILRDAVARPGFWDYIKLAFSTLLPRPTPPERDAHA